MFLFYRKDEIDNILMSVIASQENSNSLVKKEILVNEEKVTITVNSSSFESRTTAASKSSKQMNISANKSNCSKNASIKEEVGDMKSDTDEQVVCFFFA